MLLESIIELTQKTQPQLAVIPLIPVLVGAGIALLIGVVIYCTRTEKVEGKSIAILGMEGSGKTTLLCTMRDIPYQRGNLNYPKFTYHLNGRDVIINEGRDIDGGEAWMPIYKEKINNNDVTFFIFDAYKYLNDPYYRIETNGRLSFIVGSLENKSWAIMGTHLDKLEDKKNAIEQIHSYTSGKPYSKLLELNFTVLNMTEKKAIDEFLDKII